MKSLKDVGTDGSDLKNNLKIRVSPGELIDRITIITQKAEKVDSDDRRQIAQNELLELTPLYESLVFQYGDRIHVWLAELAIVNSILWDLEIEIRNKTDREMDGKGSSRKSSEIAKFNDQRAKIKAKINENLGTKGEIKDYSTSIVAGKGAGKRSQRPAFVQLYDLFSENEKSSLMKEILSRRPKFVESGVNGGEKNYRSSLVNRVGEYAERMFQRVIDEKQSQYENLIYDSERKVDRDLELQFTAHRDRDYFLAHSDNGSEEVKNRILSFVYYLRRRPNSFFGGELKIYPDSRKLGEAVLVRPVDNSMVIFRSEALHEVLPTYVPSQKFEDSRFTINGWISTEDS